MNLYLNTFLILSLLAGSLNVSANEGSLVTNAWNALKSAPSFVVTAGSKIAHDSKDFVVTQASKLDARTLGLIIAGTVGTGIAVRYASPYIGLAYERAKFNAPKFANKAVIALDQIKQTTIAGVKLGLKVGAVATVLAVPAAVAAYTQHQDTVNSAVQQAVTHGCEYVTSLVKA